MKHQGLIEAHAALPAGAGLSAADLPDEIELSAPVEFFLR